MTTSITNLYNKALSIVGTKTMVVSPEENSRERDVCDLWYPSARDQVLHAASWHSAKGIFRLALLKTRDSAVAWANDDPEPGWKYLYSLPSDCLRPRFLSTYESFVAGVSPNATPSATELNTLSTNVEKAILIYTKRQEDVRLWGPNLELAIVNALAAMIAMPLHGKITRAKYAAEQANNFILNARVAAANVDSRILDSVPSWIQARDTALATPVNRYVYPNGRSISVAEAASVS